MQFTRKERLAAPIGTSITDIFSFRYTLDTEIFTTWSFAFDHRR